MPSKRSRHSQAEFPSAFLEIEETLTVLQSHGPRLIAEMLWWRSERDESLRRQLAVMVLRSRLNPVPNVDEVKAFMNQLNKLCKFEAAWRQDDSGWAAFFAEVVSSIESLLKQFSLDLIKPQLREIIQVAEESSWTMDDCYSCGLEIERLGLILGEET